MLSAILESASQAIIGVDSGGIIVLLNERAEEMFGFARAELLGARIEILLPESAHSRHVAHRGEFFEHPHARPMGIGFDLAGRRKEGSEFPVEISLSFVQTPAGDVAIAFVTDITRRKSLEEQLVHSQKLEAVGRLASGVAHDFNNMLTIISGYNQMILDRLSPADPLHEFAGEVCKAANRAAALTAQLLAFSRRRIIQPKVLDVNTLVRDMGILLRRLISEDVDLTFELEEGPLFLRTDQSSVEQVIINLVVNARDAMPGGGHIIVETRKVRLDEDYSRTHPGVAVGDYIMIAVSDNGQGMDAETKRHIFEPFFTTKDQGKGTGLGLASVYGAMKQIGGDIWVYSELGKGTTFKLYFPAASEPFEVVGAVVRSARSPFKGTVLLVEDEDALRPLIAAMLSAEGFQVLTAARPREAIIVSAEYSEPIDLLLTDVVMPEMSGRQLAAELARSRPDTRVLYLSGYTENTIVHHGVLDHGVQFLAKPFNREDLLSKIRTVLHEV